ncbi:MAG: ABC-2 family transporter protein [Acidobacteriota bacterium]
MTGPYLHVLGLETRKLMSYRADFWLHTVVAFAVQMAIAFFLWRAIFDATGEGSIGGFAFDGMVAYYVLALLIGRLVRGKEREITIARDIYEGALSRYLLFPASYGGMKYAEHLGALAPAALQVVVLGGLAAVAVPAPAGFEISPATVAMATVVVAFANLLAFLLRFPIQAVAFWADNVWSLNVMLRFVTEFLGGLLLPLSLFPEVAQKAMAWLPFQYFFYFPVAVLIGKVDPEAWLRGLGVMALWCCLLGLLGAWVWRRGIRTYAGVGI